MNDPDPDKPRFVIPQTSNQVRTIVHQYPVELSAKVAARHQLVIFGTRILLFILLAVPLMYLVGGLNFALSITVCALILSTLFTISFALILQPLLRDSLKPFRNLSRTFAIDPSFLWFQMSDGSFSQTPIKNIHVSWVQNDSLVIMINKAVYVVVPLTTFPNPEDQEVLKANLQNAGKFGKLNFLGSVKTIKGRNL